MLKKQLYQGSYETCIGLNYNANLLHPACNRMKSAYSFYVNITCKFE